MRKRSASGVEFRLLCVCLLASVLAVVTVGAQPGPGAAKDPAPAQAPAPQDPLGRSTPRGTVFGFLSAARGDQNEVAVQYLNTRLRGEDAVELTRQLFVVLDTRLPARLREVSGTPQGSGLAPQQELVGTIASARGNVDIFVERVARAGSEPVWLFSSPTLESIPLLYEEIALDWGRTFLPRFLTTIRIGGIRLVEWLAVLLGLPVFYLLTHLLSRILTPLIGLVWGRLFKRSSLFRRDFLPPPARLLLLALAIRWLLYRVPLPLLARQFWTNLASVITITGIVWLLILFNGEVERYVQRRFPRTNLSAAAALLRLGRRVVDLLVVFAGGIALLRYYGVDPTPALAGLGVGGIAVALAAQKTLENVVAGASLIFDQAVRVGDFLKMGDIVGTVDHVGLRSTRIRTLDRTVVSIPNGQIANMSLETLSERDKFWFHPIVGLRYETTSEQLHEVVGGVRRLLSDHPLVDRESVRVRFFRLGPSSLDVEIFAYLFARDWAHFLEIQEHLLFNVIEVVNKAGTQIALPSQTMYVANPQARVPAADNVPTPAR
ncbi:MAG TPA: mechanosensitive ion channel family protein [Vicinamibacterales bacterium]|jgi:MscS family membrane protein